MSRVIVACSLSLLFASATTPLLAAEPTPEDRSTARELALEGHSALKAGDYALAVDRFTRADGLVHAPTLLVDLGRSYIGLGRLVQAHETFQQVMREGVADDAPAPWHKALQAARDEDAALKPRLAWVTIRVEGPAAAHVKLDTEDLPAASLGVRRAVDPGHRSIVAEAEGYLIATSSLDIAEGEARELKLVLRRDPNYTPPKPPPARTQQVVVIERAPSRTPAYVAFGVGGAGLLLSGVSAVLMLRAQADLQPDCPNRICKTSKVPDAPGRVGNYRTFGTLSAIGFGVGLAGAGVGAYFLLSKPSRAKGALSGSLTAQISPGYVGMSGSF